VRLFSGLLSPAEARQPQKNRPQQRIAAIRDTRTGERIAGLVQSRRSFEDQARFGIVDPPQEGACLYLAHEIETLMDTLSVEPQRDGFVILSCPAVALSDGNTAIACDAAVRRSGLLHQEVCLEFQGAALEADSVARLAKLKQRGFRLGLDVRASGPVALDNALRVLIDAVRLDARALNSTAHDDMLEAAASCGVMLIAEHAPWRDGDHLARLGVRGFIQPRADS
jgi:hypothetical protein